MHLLFGKEVAQDYGEAVKWYEKGAAKDDSYALYSLGVCYYYGHGVAIDKQKALYYFEKSANKGYALAQFNTGLCYMNGEGTSFADTSKGVYWFEKAAEQENADAQYALGVYNEYYRGIDRDINAAWSWYVRAADNGHKEAKKIVNKYERKMEKYAKKEADKVLPGWYDLFHK